MIYIYTYLEEAVLESLGIGLQITGRAYIFDSVRFCQGHPVTVCVLQAVTYLSIRPVCVTERGNERDRKKDRRKESVLTS